MTRIKTIYARTSLVIYFNLIAVLVVSGASESFVSGNEVPDSIAADNAINIDSLNDGPHVFIQDDTTAIIFYLFRNEIIRETRYGRDTVRFTGICGDSGREYAVALSYLRDTVYRFENVPRIFIISDIHGEYGDFEDILIKAGVADSSLHWAWGSGHLVVLGDIFDRGSRVTECLWLVYQLQQEAPANGGRVHFVLGNHELMVLRGDIRYVHERYL
ncbi:MAG: metallophosphoesterase, partial [Candidatus Zixiibacteriota bacterium]